MGVVETPLPSGKLDHTVWDNTNTMRVRMIYGTLASSTKLQVLNGANLAIVGKEIIQFLTATLVSTGVYDLTGIIRARFGTDWDIGNRAMGENFVLVDVTTMRRVIPAIHELNVTKPIRVSTFRQKLDTAQRMDFSHVGNGMKPLAPCKFRCATPTSTDFEIYWYRRTRVGGEQVDSVKDTPIGEDTEAYEIDVYADSGYTTVVRTISVSAPPNITGSFSVDNATQSYNRLVGSFIDDGFVAGMQLFASGFSNAVNNNYCIVTYVSALEMVVAKRGNQLGTMITEAEGSRTLLAMNPGARYTAAQQAADGVGTTIYCYIYQISQQIGRGFGESGAFTNTFGS